MGPIVAGAFYPAEAGALKAEVHRLLSEARVRRNGDVRGVIVPHAGFRYSGPVAAHAYALVDDGLYERIVLIGPSHFAWFPGAAMPMADTWAIPIGEFRIDADHDLPGLDRLREPFANEHCLEVQLPFLHEVLGPLPITPIVTGDVTPYEAAKLLELLVGDDTLLVVSTDLSHYLPSATAKRRDAESADSILSLNPEGLDRRSACGLVALQAALILARDRDWGVRLLDLHNSGDTEGDPWRVVGYGAFALER